MATVLGLKNTGVGGNAKTNETAGSENEYVLTYVVRAGSSDAIYDVLSATGLPTLYSMYGNAYCKSKEAKEIDSAARVWEVDITYSTGQQQQGDDEPQLFIPTVTWGVEEMQLVVTHDQETNDEIVNSVGEPLLVTQPYSIPIMTIKRLERTFDPNLIIDYGGHVNEKKFWGAEKNCVMLFGPTGDPHVIRGVTYYDVTYRFKFSFLKDENDDFYGWQAYLLNQGTKYWDPALSKYVKFTTMGDNTMGNLTKDPVNPRKGTARDPADDGEYLLFQTIPLADFNDLNLGP